MKKVYAIVFVILTGSLLLQNNAIAQCPGCAVNMACSVSPAKPALCPDTLPDGYAMQPYTQDVSFYLPSQFVDAGSGYNVTLNQLTILSVTGMPYGLSFQTNAVNNIYYPSSNPPATEHGCAKICGTPVMTGNYMVTVFVEAQVTVLGLSQSSNTSFTLPLRILPDSTSNGIFSIDQSIGCAPLSTNFQNQLPSNGNTGYSYAWDFGNGNQSVLETPPIQYYNAPGDYAVSLQATIDTLGYFLSSVSILGATSGCDDSPFSSPDYYFVLIDSLTNTVVYTSAYIDNTDAPVTFAFPEIQLNNTSYILQGWDYDNGLSGGDDHCNSDVYFNGHSTGTTTLTHDGFTASITITHPVIVHTATDTVHVYPPIVVSNIDVTPNDSICNGDSITLSVTPLTGDTYQWYRDTAAIYNATHSDYTTKQAGTYYCEVTNSYGCRAITNTQTTTIMANPPKPTFWITGGHILNTNLAGFQLQWYFNGTPISGANAMTYNFTATGNYSLTASVPFGCSTSSDTVFATYVNGINESEEPLSYRLFPNPNNGSFVIEFDLKAESDVNISVTDLVGKTIYDDDLGLQNGSVHKDVVLKSVSKGLYLVNLQVGNTVVHQRINVY